MVRLSVNLDDDLYAMARAYAVGQGMSISRAINDLLRRRSPTPGSTHGLRTDPRTGLPVVPSSGYPITNEMVYAADDDDVLRYQ